MMERFDVAIIGGGQSGVAAAHAPLWDGLRPLVLEAPRRRPGHSRAAPTGSPSSPTRP